MKTNYHGSITAPVPVHQAFEMVQTGVQIWWAKNFEGSSAKMDDEFTVHFGETFVTFKITELIPGKRIVWYCTDCNLHWVKDRKEWKDTQLVWEFSGKGQHSKIDMTHVGLVPGIECFETCTQGWDQHFKGSLLKILSENKNVPV
jgi:hypothetical protein